jgi:hypothetical protein
MGLAVALHCLQMSTQVSSPAAAVVASSLSRLELAIVTIPMRLILRQSYSPCLRSRTSG